MWIKKMLACSSVPTIRDDKQPDVVGLAFQLFKINIKYLLIQACPNRK